MDETRGKKLEEMLFMYQQMAMKSLAGPAGAWRPNSKHKFPLNGSQMLSNSGLAISQPKKLGELPFDFTLPLPFAIPAQLPFFLQADTSREYGDLIHYELENVSIAGFEVGGEERLCLPPILNTILKEVDIHIINDAFDELQIQCPNCSDHQLRLLKQENILPTYVNSAGLIRKTDAERLCTRLLHPSHGPITDVDSRNYPQISGTCLPVYHECFGEAHGFLYTELYTHAYAKCIACVDCEKLFTPERFVTHSHFNQENRICHWGFNRRNWRSYLLLSDDAEESDEAEMMQAAFDEVLDKFRHARKRKTATPAVVTLPTETADKIGGAAPGPSYITNISSPMRSTNAASPSIKRRCNRAPMKAYEYVKGEPKLENPDMVVSNSDSHKYGKHYVPNICLKLGGSPPGGDSESDASPLDLRSPTQRERLTSLSSNTGAELPVTVVDTSAAVTRAEPVAEEKLISPKVEEEEDEEILDVDSSPDDEDVNENLALESLPVDSTVQPVNNKTDTESGETTPNLADCIDKLERMFSEALQSSPLSEQEKLLQQEAYTSLINRVRNNIPAL